MEKYTALAIISKTEKRARRILAEVEVEAASLLNISICQVFSWNYAHALKFEKIMTFLSAGFSIGPHNACRVKAALEDLRKQGILCKRRGNDGEIVWEINFDSPVE